MGNWYIIEPAKTTNLITNPSIEKDTTGYTTNVGGAFSKSSLVQSSGLYSLEMFPTTHPFSGIIFSPLTLQVSLPYTLSFSFRGQLGVPYRAFLFDATGLAILGTPFLFSGTNTLRRYQLTATTDAINTNYQIRIEKSNDVSIAPFYIDSLQLEQGSEATTYCDGDQDGCRWLAGEHSSQSFRPATTAEGGREIDLETIGFINTDPIGVGFPPHDLIEDIPAQGDGADHQATYIRPRQFTLVGELNGTSFEEYMASRFAIERLISLDRVPNDQPLKLRFRKKGKTIEISCRYKSGLEKTKLLGPPIEKLGLTFRAQEDPFWTVVMGTGAKTAGTGLPGTVNDPDGQVGYGGATGDGAISAVVSNTVSGNFILSNEKSTDIWSPMNNGIGSSSIPGTDGPIYVVKADTALYIGGSFTTAGGVAVSNIARWDGVNWSRLGTTSFNPSIYAIAIDSAGTVYIGGDFFVIGTLTLSRIAKWDGVNWSAVGGGTNGIVRAITIAPDGSLYVGGDFTVAGGVTVNRIARWDGVQWFALSGGITSGAVRTIAIDSAGIVYVGGDFTLAGGVAVDYIARWDGVQWFALPRNIFRPVAPIFAIGIDNNDRVWIGTVFEETVIFTFFLAVAVWTGTDWQLSSALDDIVESISIAPDGSLYVGGNFTTPANKIARWDGANWFALGSGTDSIVRSIALLSDGSLYVGGDFTVAGGVAVNRIARWTGLDWKTTVEYAKALLQGRDGTIYVGGGFSFAGSVIPNTEGIASWNTITKTWSAMGTGSSGAVEALAEAPDGSIYAGGAFTSMGGVANTEGIAKWNPTTSSWSSIGNVAGVIFAIAIANNGDIYIGGRFKNAGGVANTANFAKFSNGAWTALPLQPNEKINALKFDSIDNLYIGGSFTKFGSTTYNYISKYNPTTDTFSILENGTNGYINDIEIGISGEIYFGGTFTQLGTIPANYIGRWNGTGFAELGGGTNNTVNVIESLSDGTLIIGGLFSTAGGIQIFDKAAVWAGANWTPLSINLPGDSTLTAILETSENLFIGFDTGGIAITAGIN